MTALDLSSKLVGARIHINLPGLRSAYQRDMGMTRGNAAADRLPVVWRCVYDDRADGGKPSIIVAHTKPDGDDLSIS